jgi:flavin reductase (DIM6/NTAB) family NADH-FMN oxidoreductase RutF
MSEAEATRPQRARLEVEAKLAGALRSSLGRFVTGVAVVTFAAEEGPRGMTVNSFTSVSLDPPLILVSVAKTSRSHDLLAGGIPFTVNILGAEQEVIARHFTRRGVDAPVRWGLEASSPRLVGTLAHFECAPWRSYDAGDHTLVLGEVVDFSAREGDALGFFTSRFMPVSEDRLGHEDLF